MIGFLVKVIAISLSGALAPGPVTAATLAAGTRSRHAGAMVALGHAVIEMPLILLIVAGAGAVFELSEVKLGIGLAGGAFLVFMGTWMLAAAPKVENAEQVAETRHPFVIGVVLTAANPYFLVWWATVGLALATEAVEFGSLAFVLFSLVHWLCDLVWLELLSLASHAGREVLGVRLQQGILLICGIMLLVFGAVFLKDAYFGMAELSS